MKRITALLAAACLMLAGCSQSGSQASAEKGYASMADTVLANGYMIAGDLDSQKKISDEQKEKLTDQQAPQGALRYFQSDEQRNSSTEKNYEAIASLIDQAVDYYSKEPYLISRVSAGIGGRPVLNEKKELTTFSYQPVYDEGYRFVFPQDKGMKSLWWDCDEVSTTIDDGQDVRKTNRNILTGVIDRMENVSSETEARHLQQQWIGDMFSEGVYPRIEKDQWMNYFDTYLKYVADPEFFDYTVVPVIKVKDTADSENSEYEITGWDLVIDLKEPQLLSSQLYDNGIVVRRSAGYLIDYQQIVWIRGDVKNQQMVLQFDQDGVLKSSWVNSEISMLTNGQNNQSIWSREYVNSRWDINPYPDAAQYESVLDRSIQGYIPSDFLDVMGIPDPYTEEKAPFAAK